MARTLEQIEKVLSSPLKSGDIEMRVQSCKNGYTTLLFYKDARCDMRVLDEAVGHFGWKREHHVDEKGKQFCTVSIKDPETGEWIGKSDTGTESNTEAIKGLVSDSFKRACFNWGIGRLLYDMPNVRIKGEHRFVSNWTLSYGVDKTTGKVAYVQICDPWKKDDKGNPLQMYLWADRSVDRKNIVRW